MASKLKVLFLYLSLFIHIIIAVPQRGVKEMVLDATNQYRSFAKSLFKDATITVTVTVPGQTVGNSEDDEMAKKVSKNREQSKTVPNFKLNWYLFQSDCGQYFLGMKDEVLGPLIANVKHPMYTVYSEGVIMIKDGYAKKPFDLKRDIVKIKPTTEQTTAKPTKKKTTKKAINKGPRHKRESTVDKLKEAKLKEAKLKEDKLKEDKLKENKLKEDKSKKKPTTKPTPKRTTTVPKRAGLDGNYLLVITAEDDLPGSVSVNVKVSIKMSTGYLSAADWPLLPFYGAMSLLYLAYGVVWLIVSACQWRELLRIQFWIGGVIALGMLEKAVLFSEYNNANDTGVPAHGLVMLSLVLSCIKRTLSRILIIIVSMGFGIVKPRLGGALHRVLGVGCLYFILCAVEGSYREYSVKGDVSRKQVIASVPLSVLDAVICWWIFMSLLQTMRTLRIRKNLVKLSLYRHFTNILVVSVIASVAFMVWAIKSRNLNSCIKDWKEMWVDDAFWHFLFALILLAIMVLWRPTANNQRYAFTPLIDVGEDDDDDMTLSDAFQGMKMRNKGDPEAPSRSEKQRKKVEDDLKWVEENIPTSGGIDTALPTLLDSDEEMMTTKLEMSKME